MAIQPLPLRIEMAPNGGSRATEEVTVRDCGHADDPDLVLLAHRAEVVD
jgi:hypothetical protein